MSYCTQTVSPYIILSVSHFLCKILQKLSYLGMGCTPQHSGGQLVYIQSPRPAKATWENPVSKRRRREENSFYPLEHLIIFTIPPLPNQVRLLLATLYIL